jgi:polyphosphate kinase 2 (PPK2 family)
MANLIKSIQTTIAEDELNPMLVTWDLSYYYDVPATRHPDDCQLQEEQRDVAQIQKVELLLMDKMGIDVTSYFIGAGSSKNLRTRLEEKLLEAVEFDSVDKLSGGVEA